MYIEIENWYDLKNIEEEPGKKYMLKNNLTKSTKGYNELIYNREKGWEPISKFNGEFDGNNHTIKNLKINGNKSDGIGLFGLINDNAIIKNLTITNSKINSKVELSKIGILGGQNYGEMRNITIKNSKIEAEKAKVVGGIVGKNNDKGYQVEGALEANEIYNCILRNIKIIGARNVGGLAGDNKGTIENTTVKNSRIKGKDDQVGGLVGFNHHKISDCVTKYNEIEGGARVGGIVGNSTVKIKNVRVIKTKIKAKTGYLGRIYGHKTRNIPKLKESEYKAEDVELIEKY